MTQQIMSFVEVRFDGKKPFFIGGMNFELESLTTEDQARAHVAEHSKDMIDKFFAEHFPDSFTDRPVFIHITFGKLIFTPHNW